MQNVKHVAENAGHTVQNDSHTTPIIEKTLVSRNDF